MVQFASIAPSHGRGVASHRTGSAVNRRRRLDVSVVIRGDAETSEVEDFVRECYRERHQADIREFMPAFLTLRTNAKLVGVLGFRPADQARLFLEAYLDEPIEKTLGQRIGIEPQRSTLVEVGNLVSSTPGGARWLISSSTALFMGMGLRWAVLTATPGLLNSFRKLGIAFVPLAPAAKERIDDADKYWGSYYDEQPFVVVSDISTAFHRLNSQLAGPLQSPGGITLWKRAYRLGLLEEGAGVREASASYWGR